MEEFPEYTREEVRSAALEFGSERCANLIDSPWAETWQVHIGISNYARFVRIHYTSENVEHEIILQFNIAMGC